MKKRGMIRLSSTLVLLAFSLLLCGREPLLRASLSAAVFHECGHIAAARILHVPLSDFRLDFLGARLGVRGRMLSYSEEWALCAAGPFFSFLLAGILLPLKATSDFALSVSASSLALGVLNLLPIRTFDGGRMLLSFLSLCRGEPFANRLLSLCTALCLFLLFLLSVYLLLRTGDGVCPLVFSLSLLSRFSEKKTPSNAPLFLQ